MLGPLLFDNRGAIVKKFVLPKKKFLTVKKIPKKPFSQKKLFTEHEFEKCCEAKKMHKGHITGRRKNFNKKKIKIEGVAFISKKYLKSHFRDPKKRFFQFRILRSVSVCSLYLLQTVV